MKFGHRLLYFSGGSVIGIIIVLFILSGKKTSCAYGPQARTLKHLRVKPRTFSNASLEFFSRNGLDTSRIDDVFLNGKVDFSKSDTRSESCKEYHVDGDIDENKLRVIVSYCDEKATIQQVDFQD